MQGKTRVLLFTTAFLPLVGGSEIAIDEITRRLPDVHFDIITGRLDVSSRFDRRLPACESWANRTIHRVGNPVTASRFLLPKNFLPLSIFFKALKLARQNNYTAIHAYQASQAAGAALLFKIFHPRIPFILTIQEGKDLKSQGLLTNLFRNFIIKKADTITVISNYLGDYVRKIKPDA